MPRKRNHQAPRVSTGQSYGAAGQQLAAQEIIPLPAAAPPPRPQPVTSRTSAAPAAFMRPSERPDEPVTAGLPIGPGPGPEVLRRGPQVAMPDDPVDRQLRALYSRYPYEGLRDLIEDLDAS